ncbi:MAG TPA: ATP-dependent metallopeptidase FtsH/Yme1/Tma family protein [candidate division Zixibacteria bacterium]|nr:ATP-dependent metallopeptidase FtsH/Yme1/Tma family protein [candidate division Zixibacteria bacterium]
MKENFKKYFSSDDDDKRPPRKPADKKRPPSEERKDEFNWKKSGRTLFFWAIIIIVFIFAFKMLSSGGADIIELEYSQYIKQLKQDNIQEVVMAEKEIEGKFRQPYSGTVRGTAREFQRFKTVMPVKSYEEVKLLLEHDVNIKARIDDWGWITILIGSAPWILLILFFFFMMRQMQSGGPKGLFSFGKSKARLASDVGPKVTFADVAGCDEAKEELEEIIEFLKEPGKFQKLGGKIPKGALLLGSPGTGKTLLARAVAGEAGVPFFSMSGSDFVEMFVGVGASRVRDLFDQGKKNAPCIIFIDEIDAVGRHRGAGLGGGHDEREQTLNQLLVEMDGFDANDGVILIAATNRPDVLDPALLRPGRFDRRIVVDQPDVKGRRGIFEVHVRKINLADDVDLEILARATPGMSGADIANMVNEAALLAARREHDKVYMVDMEDAKDKVILGTERRSLVINEEEKKTTAYHEAGHALLGKLLPKADPVYKVTIIPRGMSLGQTSSLPVDEKRTYTKEYLEAMLVVFMGGRVAEKLVFDHLSTGAGNDLARATELTRKMVCDWGMSESLGALTFGKKDNEVFLGRDIIRDRNYSEETARQIDIEVRKIIEDAENRARELLEANVDKLHKIAEALLERELLDGEDLEKIINGEELEEIPAPSSKT